MVLGPANYTQPAFPLKVGWRPPQIHFKVGLTGTEAQLRDEAQGLFVAVDSVEYDWDWEAASTGTTTINGRAATLRTGTDENNRPTVGVTWRLADGRWVAVDSVGGLPQAQVLRVARSIITGVTPATGLPFTLRYAPTGFVLANVLADGACFSPAQWPLEPRSLNGLCVWVESPTTSPGDDPDYGAVSLGGRPGHLLRTAYHWLQYWARLPDGRLLTITTSNGPVVDVPNTTRDVNAWLDISDADLATFIAGIAIGP